MTIDASAVWIGLGIGLAAFALGALAAGWRLQRRLGQHQQQTQNLALDLAACRARLEQTQAGLDRCAEQHERQRLESQDLVARNAELEALRQQEKKAAAEKISLLEDVGRQLTDSYRSLSAAALAENNRSFLDLAQQTLGKFMETARGDLTLKGEAIGALVAPLKEALDRYQTQALEMERVRQQAYGSLSEQVTALIKTQQELEKETGKLVLALKAPQARGRWGEITLRRVAELTGMQAHCDFSEQVSAAGPEGQLRPDMVVHLPENRLVVVDAKVSLAAFLDSLQAANEEARAACLAAHARQVQTHVLRLAQKSYWQQFQPTPDFVVLFIPGENFFAAALTQIPGLIEFAVEKGVILATPTTLIALLKAVSFGWRQAQMAQNAKVIGELGKQLFGRLATFAKHMEPLGKDIARCVENYNKLVGSLETRVLPAARKFEALGLAPEGSLPPIEPLDKAIRPLTDTQPPNGS